MERGLGRRAGDLRRRRLLLRRGGVPRDVAANGATQARVLMNRLHAGQYDGIAQADGQAPLGPQGADQPEVAVTEYGRGWVTSETDQTHDIVRPPLAANAAPTTSARVDSQVNQAPPDAVPGAAGTISTLIAWQQNPGQQRPAGDPPPLRPRRLRPRARAGPVLPHAGPDRCRRRPGRRRRSVRRRGGRLGPGTAGARGDRGRPAVPGPGLVRAAVLVPLRRQRQPDPVLVGGLRAVGLPAVHASASTASRSPAPTPPRSAARCRSANGRHTWQVTAVNQAGLSTVAKVGTVFVDTVRRGCRSSSAVPAPWGRPSGSPSSVNDAPGAAAQEPSLGDPDGPGQVGRRRQADHPQRQGQPRLQAPARLHGHGDRQGPGRQQDGGHPQAQDRRGRGRPERQGQVQVQGQRQGSRPTRSIALPSSRLRA